MLLLSLVNIILYNSILHAAMLAAQERYSDVGCQQKAGSRSVMLGHYQGDVVFEIIGAYLLNVFFYLVVSFYWRVEM